MGQYPRRFRRVGLSYIKAVTGHGVDVFAICFDDIGLIYTSHLDISIGVRDAIRFTTSCGFWSGFQCHVETSQAIFVVITLVAPFGEGGNQFLFRGKLGQAAGVGGCIFGIGLNIIWAAANGNKYDSQNQNGETIKLILFHIVFTSY